MLDFLLAHKADIICLQELTRGYINQTHENTWQYLAHELGYDYHFQDMPIVTDAEEWFQANAIFSRFPIIGRTSTWLNEPTGTEAYGDQYRSYIEVDIKSGQKALTVGTTHLSYTGKVPISDRRAKEVRTLLKFVKPTENYILTGDLNALPDSEFISELSQRLVHAGPDFSQKTWTTKPASYHGLGTKTLSSRLDYIFVSRNIKVASAKIIQTEISDHLPIFAELKVV